MTPISDYNAFCSKYISKKEKAVPLSVSREIERLYMEESTKCRIALGDIERAHRELDKIGLKRNQRNSNFPLSLAGRIRNMKSANKSLHGTAKGQPILKCERLNNLFRFKKMNA